MDLVATSISILFLATILGSSITSSFFLVYLVIPSTILFIFILVIVSSRFSFTLTISSLTSVAITIAK